LTELNESVLWLLDIATADQVDADHRESQADHRFFVAPPKLFCLVQKKLIATAVTLKWNGKRRYLRCSHSNPRSFDD
jgi:hypothetical protein